MTSAGTGNQTEKSPSSGKNQSSKNLLLKARYNVAKSAGNQRKFGTFLHGKVTEKIAKSRKIGTIIEAKK